MELRTTFRIDRSDIRITYNDPVMFIGSCFAGNIGTIMQEGKMPVMINPSGTVYNPVSVHNTIYDIISAKKFAAGDLHYFDGNYLSFSHYTDFSSPVQDEVLDRINRSSSAALAFLQKASCLFITFGTARVYRWKESGMIVSNCHKIPACQFEMDLLTVDGIASLWSGLLDRLFSLFPNLRIIFTVSPVRHWKDGAHGNQVSKSVLMLAVEELLRHPSKPQYFPAYEIMMDDLRDYRFYADDLLNPSALAIKYIWNAFADCFIDIEALTLRNQVIKITKALRHRINTSQPEQISRFADGMIREIKKLKSALSEVDFEVEESYFRNLLSK